MTPQKWLVTGLGNPLLGCDGFGPAVVERLRQRSELPPGTELEDAQPDLLALFDRFASFDGVVLVDAVLGTGQRGVSVISEDTFASWNAASANTHEWSPLLSVKLFRLLQATRTRFVLVGLVVSQIDAASPATPAEVEAGMEAVLHVLATTV